MYVESLEPEKVTQPYPLVLIHGDFHSGKVWLDKPDGNPGWAAYFLKQGYHVYLVDLPGVGRSGKHPSSTGGNVAKLSSLTPQTVEQELTCPEKYPWHQASAWETVARHTQWPGDGRQGDPIFTQYMASVTRQTQAQEALSALLQRTGKAILVGEGTGCIMAWLTTDVMHGLVAGVLSIEPSGPPFGSARSRGRLYGHRAVFDPEVREWGLADIPLTYDPPLPKPQAIIPDPTVDRRNNPFFPLCEYTNPEDPRKSCFMQNPVRVTDGGEMIFHQLLHLRKVPHAVITAEASSHSIFDWATVAFMRQAGLQVSWLRLEELCIRGNGRLMFLEKNSDEIALVLHKWMARLPAVNQGMVVPAPASALEALPKPVPGPKSAPVPVSEVANGVVSLSCLWMLFWGKLMMIMGIKHMYNSGPSSIPAVQPQGMETQHQIEAGWQFV
uniref:AB hydrolase-1 domain-containing protein n=1 Tax=Bionectria ochroleuca TaxID=29856 RepID=A0A0B7JPZ7_BIOOC